MIYMGSQPTETIATTDITRLLEESGADRYELSVNTHLNYSEVVIRDISAYAQLTRKLGLECYKNHNFYHEIRLDSSAHKGWVFIYIPDACFGLNIPFSESRAKVSEVRAKVNSILVDLEREGFVKGWVGQRTSA